WYIPVETPSGPQVLFFDTGYARTTCDDALVRSLDLPVRGRSRIRGEVGATVARHTRVPTLRFGEHRVTGARCQVRDLGSTSSITDPTEGPVAGVLGIDVLRRFVVVIDPVAATLTLRRPTRRPAAHHRMRREGGVGPRMLVAVEVDGHRLRPVLDTGADQTWVRGAGADLVAAQVREGVRVRGTGVPGGQVRTLRYYHVPELGFGGQIARDLVFIERSRPWWSDGLLGLDVIGQFRGTYDFPHRRFALEPVDAERAPAWDPGQATPAAISSGW
ncbi:MAG: aspartyl protease family protein, partial [Deltaproteobacteria bacterium]|nr:aspartyl protease family protein [Deltaproteobacteria bacterium]